MTNNLSYILGSNQNLSYILDQKFILDLSFTEINFGLGQKYKINVG